MVLCHPDLVESHLVQHLHLLEHPAVELRLWPVQRGDIRWQVVGSELHTRALVVEGVWRIGGWSMAVSSALCKAASDILSTGVGTFTSQEPWAGCGTPLAASAGRPWPIVIL